MHSLRPRPDLRAAALFSALTICSGAISASDPDAGPDADAEQPESDLPATSAEVMEQKTAPKKPLSLSLTVSGGVSLGAYQAGYLYYLTEVAKLNRELFEIRLLTGASAGTINTLLTMLSLGSAPEDEPAETLLYRLWVGIHFKDLFDVDQAPPLALSSRRVLEDLADHVEEKWNRGLDNNLDMVIGATATRLESHNVEISEGFSVPRQEEKFVFRVQGRGAGREPRVSNYVDQTYGSEQPLLPFVDVDRPEITGERTNFSVIRQILFASSAIPIVFLPQKIDFCMTSPSGMDGESIYALKACPSPKFTEDFVDGSLADRRPLRLAHRIAVSGLNRAPDGTITWRDRPDLERGTLPDELYFLYVDPTRHSYPDNESERENKRTAEQATRFFPSLGIFMRGFLVSARAKEVATLIDEHPEVRQKMLLVTHDFPTTSGLMAKFFGFFDREFRKFDFYLGMRDARRYVEQSLGPWMSRLLEDEKMEIVYPEPAKMAARSIAKTDSWRPFFCLRAEIDGKKNFQAACDADELRDFRILLQVAFDRLYDQCRWFPYDETIDNVHCKRAMDKEPPPVVWRVDAMGDDWQRKTENEEGELAHAIRLLEKYEFHFRDLGLDRDDASLAMSRIRMEMLLLLDQYAKKLPPGERLAVRLLGKPGINFFKYAPPETIVYAVAGTGAEVAISATLGQSSWLRFNFALQTQGFYYLLTEQPNVFVLTPLAGLEAEIYPLSSPLLQTRLGLRVGYQLSTDDKFLFNECRTDIFENDSLRCSAPVAQVMVAFSFYERIRLQGGVEWFPRWLPPMSDFKDDVWNGFIEVGWQWISPF